MNYVIDGRSGVLKSWGALNADIQLTAVTSFEVKDQRKLSTYAGAWGGFGARADGQGSGQQRPISP